MIAKVLYRLVTVLSVIWMGGAGFVFLANPQMNIVKIHVEGKLLSVRAPAGVTRTAIKKFAQREMEQLRKQEAQGNPFSQSVRQDYEAGAVFKWEPSLVERGAAVFTQPRAVFGLFGPPVVLFLLVATGTWIFAPLRNFFRSPENRFRD